VAHLVPFQCNPATSYNELASLYFTDSDTAIKQLFHFREVSARLVTPAHCLCVACATKSLDRQRLWQS
jgi:hypothetical protein